jgi:hypothetical protein
MEGNLEEYRRHIDSKYTPALDHSQISSLGEQKASFQHAQHHPVVSIKLWLPDSCVDPSKAIKDRNKTQMLMLQEGISNIGIYNWIDVHTLFFSEYKLWLGVFFNI